MGRGKRKNIPRLQVRGNKGKGEGRREGGREGGVFRSFRLISKRKDCSGAIVLYIK